MKFQLLGPLTIWTATGQINPGGPRERAILTWLLLRVNRTVSVDELAAVVWGKSPPASAGKQVRNLTAALRRALEGAGDATETGIENGTDAGFQLVTQPSGYLLRADPAGIDLEEFGRLARDGRQALVDGDMAVAADRLGAALSLWRGPALCGTSGPLLGREAARLEEERLSALGDRIEAELALGRSDVFIAELVTVVAEHPLREGFRRQLMLALYRAGRRAEALEVYRAGRRVLVEELGIEPSQRLQELERSILRDDVGAPSSPGEIAPPCLLPAMVPDLVGREEQVAELTSQLVRGGTAGPLRIVVTGAAGAGKTSLAVHVAHGVRGSFPDGQLYACLRDTDRSAVDPADVLVWFLRALGVPAGAIPSSLEERSQLYRTCIADRRVLVVLDDAVYERQVRPLLPGTAQCAVLVTSRGRLLGLECMQRMALGVLAEAPALELFTRVAGREPGPDDAQAAARIVTLCGRLPLALRIAGARVTTSRHRGLGHLADALGAEHDRLDELTAGDLEVRASLRLSYADLDEVTRKAFRLLGLLDAMDYPAWVIAALLDISAVHAERLVENLVDVHLLEPTAPDSSGQTRYRYHDLVRLYARERAVAEEPEPERAGALTRVLSGYLALAVQADDRLHNSFFGPTPSPTAPWQLTQPYAESLLADPLTWFDAERVALRAAVSQAIAIGRTDLAWGLAAAAAAYCEARAHFDDWHATHQTALAAVRETGDQRGEAVLLRNLGELRTIQDEYDEAIGCFTIAHQRFREISEPAGEAAAVSGLGMLYRLRGRYGQALRAFERGLALARQTAHPPSEVYARNGIGTVHRECGDLREAADHHADALVLARQIGYGPGEATALRCLGLVHRAHGRLDQAVDAFTEAHTVATKLGDLPSQTHANHWLGQLCAEQGDVVRALALLEECLMAYQRIGERFGIALSLHALADAHLRQGRINLALRTIQSSLHTWEHIGCPYWHAQAVDTLSAIHLRAGNTGAAEHASGLARALRDQIDCRLGTQSAHQMVPGQAHGADVYALGTRGDEQRSQGPFDGRSQSDG